MRRIILRALLVVVVACSQAPPLEGIDLPPASLPDALEESIWAIAFSHEFEPGFWEEGPHAYSLHLQCEPAMDQPLDTEELPFVSDPGAPMFTTPVYLRLGGLARSQFAPPSLNTIHPDQPTKAIVTVIGVAEQDIEAASECAGEIRYDAETAVLSPEEPVKP